MIEKDEQYYLPDFVNIEVTNHCNMRCIICPHGHDLIEKKGYMNFNTFKKIIDEMSTYQTWKPERINLVGVGESLLHPEFVKMAQYGKAAGFIQMVTTNAFFLTPEKTDEIVDANVLDHIEISFDNGKENFERYKGGKIYDIIMRNIEYFLERNMQTNVRIKFIQYDMKRKDFKLPENITKKFTGPNVTFVACELSSWRGALDMSFVSEEVRDSVSKKLRDEPTHTKCNNGANMGMFSWDGSLRACYLDYNNEYVFGNVNEKNAIDLLLSEERKKFIDNIVNGKHLSNDLCTHCLAPYNAFDRKLVLESSQKGRVETKGTQWFSVRNNNSSN